MKKGKNFPQVFFDVTIGATAAGRIVFDLYTDLTPKTAENFRGLCTGEYGKAGLQLQANTKPLHFLGSLFHRIIPKFAIQGGDITNQDGTGGATIYGTKYFNDENFQRRHACAGLLSMANRGRNTNSSQFFVTLAACPHLDGKHVIFGQVCQGMEVVREISRVPTDKADHPLLPVRVVNCGEIDDVRDFLHQDPFKKEYFQGILDLKKQVNAVKEIELQNELIQLRHEEQQKIHPSLQQSLQQQTAQTTQQNQGFIKEELDLEEKDKEKEKEKETPLQTQILQDDSVLSLDASSKLSLKNQQRLLQLKLRMNEAKHLNNRAVIEENKKSSDPQYKTNIMREVKQHQKEKQKDDLQFKGISQDKAYLNKTAIHSQKIENGKRKKVFSNQGNVLNDETLFEGYKKKWKGLKFYKDIYDKEKALLIKNKESIQTQNVNEKDLQIKDIMLDALQKSVEEQIYKREHRSRKRVDLGQEAHISSINDKNKVFNQKVARFYDKYATEIKSNIERGSAI